jgi:thioredoxin-related protein
MAVIAIVLLSQSLLFADDYSDAMKRARTEGNPMVLYFYSKYCYYCDEMEKRVLSDGEIRTLLKSGVVTLRIDVDKRDDLAAPYNVWSYPTTWLLEPTGKRIARVPGYVSKGEFKKILVYLREGHYKNMGLRDFLRK